MAESAGGLPGKVTETSLTLEPGLSISEWAAALQLIGRFHRGSPWWVGDALCYGSDHWHEKYVQFVEETGLSPSALAARERISRQIPPERRHANLSLTHHQAVLMLLPAQQEALLAQADREGWNSTTLRQAARRLSNRPDPDRKGLGDLGDDLSAAAQAYLEATDGVVDVHVERRSLIVAIAAWQSRRDPDDD